MKTNLLLMSAIAAALTLAGSAFAGDALLSPRAQDLQDSLRKVPSTTEPNMVPSSMLASPRLAEQQASMRRVPASNTGNELIQAAHPTLAPKDPRNHVALR